MQTLSAGLVVSDTLSYNIAMNIKRKIAIIFPLLLLLSAAGFYYVHRVLPGFLKEKITSALSEYSGLHASFETVRVGFFKGIVISGVRLTEPGDPAKKILEIKEASATMLILPFLKEKTVIVPSLKIRGGSLYLERRRDTTLNLSPLFDRISHNKAGRQQNILIRNIEITDSNVFFTDEMPIPSAAFVWRLRRLSASVSPSHVTIKAYSALSRDSYEAGLDVRAAYDFRKKRLEGELRVRNLDLAMGLGYIPTQPVTLEAAYLTDAGMDFAADEKTVVVQGRLRLDRLNMTQKELSFKDAALNGVFELRAPLHDFGLFRCDGNVNFEKGAFLIREPFTGGGEFLGRAAFGAAKDGVKLSPVLSIAHFTAEKHNVKLATTDIETSFLLALPFEKKDGSEIGYVGKARVTSEGLTGLPRVDKISGINMEVDFKNGLIEIKAMSANVLDAPTNAIGKIGRESAYLDISGEFDAARLMKIIPEVGGLSAIEASGTASLNLHMETKLPPEGTPNISGEAAFKNLSVKMPGQHIEASSPKGRLKFDTEEENLAWHFESVSCFGQTFVLDGTMKNFSIPAVHAVAIGRAFKLETDFAKKGNLLRIASLKGNFRDSEIDIAGEIRLEENLKIKGLARIELSDLAFLLPQTRAALEKSAPHGRIFVEAVISGPAQNPRLWRATAKGESDAVRIYGLNLSRVQWDYSQIKTEGFLEGCSFEAYGGKGSLRGKLTFDAEGVGYALRGVFENVDLARLKNDTPLADKHFAGTLSLNLAVKGTAGDAKTLSGGGSILIKDGNLWEFNPLKGLGQFLFIPRFSTIVFTNARGDFFIREGQISTDNFELLGPELGLIAEGGVSFDGDLDLLVNTQVPMAQPAQETGDRILPGEVMEAVSKAGSVTAIKITGNVREPKYKLQPVAENIMKKLGDLFSHILP